MAKKLRITLKIELTERDIRLRYITLKKEMCDLLQARSQLE